MNPSHPTATQLSKDGISTLKGVFDPSSASFCEFLEFAEQTCQFAHERLDTKGASDRRVVARHPKYSLEYSRGRHGRYDFSTRVHFDIEKRLGRYPAFVREIVESSAILETLQARFGVAIKPNKLIIEECSTLPCEDSEPWHIDSLRDQIKVMLPLIPIRPGMGGMRYIPGSHREISAAFRPYYFLSYAGLSPSMEIPASVAHISDVAHLDVTGEPGDAVVFDTLGTHARSRIRERRLVAVLTFGFNSIPTLRNRVIRRISAGRHL